MQAQSFSEAQQYERVHKPGFKVTDEDLQPLTDSPS